MRLHMWEPPYCTLHPACTCKAQLYLRINVCSKNAFHSPISRACRKITDSTNRNFFAWWMYSDDPDGIPSKQRTQTQLFQRLHIILDSALFVINQNSHQISRLVHRKSHEAHWIQSNSTHWRKQFIMELSEKSMQLHKWSHEHATKPFFDIKWRLTLFTREYP